MDIIYRLQTQRRCRGPQSRLTSGLLVVHATKVSFMEDLQEESISEIKVKRNPVNNLAQAM